MDIASMSMALNQSKLSDEVALSVVKMSINCAISNSDNINKIIEGLEDPNIGQTIDFKA